MLIVRCLLSNGNFDHLHWRFWTILRAGWRGFDRFNNVHTRGHFAKHWVLRLARAEPVEERVVHRVYEKLSAARVWCAGVRHRQRAWLIRELKRWWMFVLDAAQWRVASASAWRRWVFRKFTAELHHEVFDDAVKVQAIVEAHLRELYKVASRRWHLIAVDFRGEGAQRSFKRCSWIRHAELVAPQARARVGRNGINALLRRRRRRVCGRSGRRIFR